MVPEVAGSNPVFHPTDAPCGRSARPAHWVSVSCADKLTKRSGGSFVSTSTPMKYHVYILYSRSLDRFYVGQTKDLQNRLVEHNQGESAYTSTGSPWTLLWSTTKATFRSAELLEEKLKNLSRVRKIKFMYKYKDSIANQDVLDQLRDQILK